MIFYLFFAFLNLLLLLAGEELPDGLVPAEDPLVHDGEISRGGVEGVIHTAAQSLALTWHRDTSSHITSSQSWTCPTPTDSPESSPIHFPLWTTTSPRRLLLKWSTSCWRGPSSLHVSRLGKEKKTTHFRPCDHRRVPVSDCSALGPVSAAGRGSPSVPQRFLHFRRIHRRAGAWRLSFYSRRDRDHALQTLLNHTHHMLSLDLSIIIRPVNHHQTCQSLLPVNHY